MHEANKVRAHLQSARCGSRAVLAFLRFVVHLLFLVVFCRFSNHANARYLFPTRKLPQLGSLGNSVAAFCRPFQFSARCRAPVASARPRLHAANGARQTR